MKHCAPELGGRERSVETLRTQRVRVQALKRLARCHIGRKEAVLNQAIEHAGLAPQESITPPPHGARSTPGDGER